MQYLSDKDRANFFGILDSIDSIINFTSEYEDAASFYKDKKTFDAVLMNFIVIGELVGRLPGEIKLKLNKIPWQRVQSFRNMIAHDYFGINADIVWEIIEKEIPIIKSLIEDILI
ncbi:MAG: DUF86 domain-containing protein [Saprospiraceae bacterium]